MPQADYLAGAVSVAPSTTGAVAFCSLTDTVTVRDQATDRVRAGPFGADTGPVRHLDISPDGRRRGPLLGRGHQRPAR